MPTTKSTERGRGVPTKATKTVVRTTLKDTAPPSLIQLQNALRTARWETNAKVLDITALVCSTEQAWRIARGQLLTLFNNEDRTQKLIVDQHRLIMDSEGGALGASENGNA